MTSTVDYEVLIRSHERFKYFYKIFNLTTSKNTSVNHGKSKHYKKLNFKRNKIQKSNFKKWTQNSLEALIHSFARFKYVFQYEQTCCPGG